MPADQRAGLTITNRYASRRNEDLPHEKPTSRDLPNTLSTSKSSHSYPTDSTASLNASLNSCGRQLNYYHRAGLSRIGSSHRGHDQSISLIVKPAQPFLDWLHQVDLTSARLTLEDLQREPTIYLVPDCDSEDQAIGYQGESVSDILEEHLV